MIKQLIHVLITIFCITCKLLNLVILNIALQMYVLHKASVKQDFIFQGVTTLEVELVPLTRNTHNYVHLQCCTYVNLSDIHCLDITM